jgi:hypothetical protein
VKEELGQEVAAEGKPFGASRGWFRYLKKWYGFIHVKIEGEAASADAEVDDTFPADLKGTIEGGWYCFEQVVNADKTGLYWK